MRKSRTLAGISGLAVAASALIGLAPATSAEPTAPGRSVEAAELDDTRLSTSKGRGAGTAATATDTADARVVRQAAAAPSVRDPLVMPTSYPFQPALRFYRDNPDDAADTPALLTHPDLAPQLTEWMAESDRISTQVIGESTQGRDLYLVTVTAPEREADTAQQAAWKDEIRNAPATAATDARLLAQYKTPVWFSANIHGNEWEGTDAVMRYIDYLVSAPESEVSSLLRNNRLYFSLSLNPDGRTNATRATALGLDPNRDMITNTTAEATSFIKTAQAIQPIYSADLHGYTSVLQVEPTGPPHGSNYEYDLYLPHNYALALAVEADVVAAAIPGNTYFNTTTGAVVPANTGPETAHIKIPYRDTPTGWDDFPPIFTAQYAAFFGASTSTVELPLSRNATGGRQSAANAVVNVAVGTQTVRSMANYMNVAANARAMLANQIEVFRRGAAGEPKKSLTVSTVAAVPGPAQWKPLWDVADDQEPVSLPRAYVIPVGATQRSASDAEALVRQLLFHDIEVGTLGAATTVGATTYPAGSYVVDLHQPLRGLANSLLDLGDDISAKVPSMYDISAWSYSYLWGATVDKVGATTGAALGATTPVTSLPAAGSVPAGAGYLSLDVAGIADVRALNALLEAEATVSLLADGSAVVGPDGYAAASAAATQQGVRFTRATAADLAALDDAGTKGLDDLTIAYTGTQDDRLSLLELGFDDLVPVTAATITATPSVLDGADLLWLGSGLAFTDAQAAGRAAVQAWVDAGHSIVGRGATALTATRTFGLVNATAVAGNTSGNGIVAVDTPADSVLAPYAQDAAFIYPAVSFTDLGARTRAEQTYGAGNPLLAGHWRDTTTTNGPLVAGGKASVVSGQAATGGAKGLVFGTSVFFRTHPKGQMSQAARALFWAAEGTSGVVAPSSTSVTVVGSQSVTYPGAATFDILVASPSGVPTGTVALVDQADRSVVASAPVAAGSARLSVSGLQPGARTYAAVFTPDRAVFEPSSSAGIPLTVLKASSALTLKASKVGKVKSGKGKVRVTVGLSIPGLPATGTVVLRDRGKVVRTITLTPGAEGTRTVRLTLKRGKHRLVASFEATAVVEGSSAATRVRVR